MMNTHLQDIIRFLNSSGHVWGYVFPLFGFSFVCLFKKVFIPF